MVLLFNLGNGKVWRVESGLYKWQTATDEGYCELLNDAMYCLGYKESK